MNPERAILQVLKDVYPRMLREDILLIESNFHVDREMMPSDFKTHLASLDRKRQAVGIPTEDSRRWKITAEGIARLQEPA